ncbi:unnamed protein product [Peniophora sp. CBMAI 1063]|nr:unnamed protein product [Peniophora sp. CBMAI 1063]
MYGYGTNNTTYYQPPPQPQAQADAAYHEAVARQHAQYDAYARAHQQQQNMHAQFLRQTTADAQRQAQQAQQFQQDFLRQTSGAGGRMPQTFHNFGRDSDDEDDSMGSSRNRMDVDSAGPGPVPGFPQANIPSFPQPSYAPGPAPSFPTPQQHQNPQSASASASAYASYPHRQTPSARTQHEAATRIQRFWRAYLSQRTWRRNASLHQLSVLRRKFDGLVAEFVPPATLSYAPTPDAPEILVPTSPVPYTSFIRLSSDVLSSLGRAAPLSFNVEMKPIHATSEEFVRVLGKLDAVNSWGDPRVREARKALAGAVEGEASRLESWVKVVWFSRDGRVAPGMPQASTGAQSMPQPAGGMGAAPSMPQMPTMPTMPQPMQDERQAWEQELQDRERRGSYQPPPGPPPSQPQPSTQQQQPQPTTQQEHPSLRQLSDLRAQFAKLSSDFAVPEILEYTLQPARLMSNHLELIARLPTSYLPYSTYTPSLPSSQPSSTQSQAKKDYSGPPLAFSAPNKPLHAYNESLSQLLGLLDAVESGGDVRVRDARKGLAGDVEGEAVRLEGWWKELTRSSLPLLATWQPELRSTPQPSVSMSLRKVIAKTACARMPCPELVYHPDLDLDDTVECPLCSERCMRVDDTHPRWCSRLRNLNRVERDATPESGYSTYNVYIETTKTRSLSWTGVLLSLTGLNDGLDAEWLVYVMSATRCEGCYLTPAQKPDIPAFAACPRCELAHWCSSTCKAAFDRIHTPSQCDALYEAECADRLEADWRRMANRPQNFNIATERSFHPRYVPLTSISGWNEYFRISDPRVSETISRIAEVYGKHDLRRSGRGAALLVKEAYSPPLTIATALERAHRTWLLERRSASTSSAKHSTSWAIEACSRTYCITIPACVPSTCVSSVRKLAARLRVRIKRARSVNGREGTHAPDLVVGFNTGMSEVDESSWAKTLDVILDKSTPALFTADTKREADMEEKMLRGRGAHFVQGVECNRWRGVRAMTHLPCEEAFLDGGQHTTGYSSHYVYMIQGREPGYQSVQQWQEESGGCIVV